MAEHGGGIYALFLYLHPEQFPCNSTLSSYHDHFLSKSHHNIETTIWIQHCPDLDEASRAELDAIQGNLAKLKGRKGLDDLDVDEWVDKNKRVKAVTIIFYETSLWDI